MNEQTNKLIHLKQQIGLTLSCIQKNHRASTKLCVNLEMDRITKLSMSVLKDEKTRDMVSELQVSDTTPPKYVTYSGKMATLVATYHEQIQTDKEPPNLWQEALTDVLPFISKWLSDRNRAVLTSKMDKSYISRALKASMNGVATGLNGHITEFYKKCALIHEKTKHSDQPTFDFIGTFTKVCQDIETYGLADSTGFMDGWMCPIYKKKDCSDIANYQSWTTTINYSPRH